MAKENIEVGSLVELRSGREDVYQRAVAKSRGIVRAAKEDDFGFPQIYIAWDKDHWRYNGEEDGWTYTDHFTVLREPEINELVGAEPYDVPNVIDEEMSEQEERIAEYLDQMMAAFDKASESDAFFLITIRKEVDPDHGNMMLVDIIKGASDEELDHIPDEELFGFVQREMRRRNQ